MFGNFTDCATAAVGRAQDFAAGRGSTEIDALDVALAVLVQREPIVDGGLAALAQQLTGRARAAAPGARAGTDQAQLDRLNHSSCTDRIPGQHIAFAESAIATFRGAWKKARWDGRKSVDEYDLLMAAIEQPALAHARTAAGIDLDAALGVIGDLRQWAAS